MSEEYSIEFEVPTPESAVLAGSGHIVENGWGVFWSDHTTSRSELTQVYEDEMDALGRADYLNFELGWSGEGLDPLQLQTSYFVGKVVLESIAQRTVKNVKYSRVEE